MTSLLSSLGDVVSLAIAHALVYEELKNLVQTKTRFMFQASHELRSPLNTIQSMARTLLEGHLGELSERQRDMLSRIDLRSQTLSEIVGDLLVLALGRAELTTLRPEPVDLLRLLREHVQFFETRARDKNVEVEGHYSVTEATVLGRREGLASVITNLLSNAIKYTPPGGRVNLRLFESKEQLVFEVADSGIGIPKEEQDKLFTEFFRASNAKDVAGAGTGLGLAIVKATVEQHGGRIDVESAEGQGTTFRIFLNKAEVKLAVGV
jgi:signal transduction histidine kinase